MNKYSQLPYPTLPQYSDAERLERASAFYEQLRCRRTCRFFADTPVPRALIEQAILAAGTAPSGANHQPWHFAAIGSSQAKREVRRLAEDEERAFYAEKASAEWLDALAPLGTDDVKPYLEIAPWLIAVFGQRRGGPNPGDARQNYYLTESVGIAAGLLLATLHDAGLATLTHTPAPMKFLNTICARPADEKPLMLIVVGHPAPGATVPEHAVTRKRLDQVSSWI
ncbi:nitroreductase family protein [Novosphingobium sp.]|uniref:nitroreductase family protein n=1 Tax=Novosphingobium sp. TaxID=1874826 RepID=UPI0025F61385|nr:nitroreductase family protein [Novosphingobium sp.]